MSEADKIIENLRKSGRKVEEFYTGNKTSDKNVVTEDDVKILEEFAEICKAGLACYDQTREGESLERILSEREQMLKAINTVEKEKGDWIKAYQEEKDSQFDLLKRIQELEKENADLKKYNKTVSDRIVEYKKNSIPKQVVIDKIEEVHNMKFKDDRLNGATIDFAVHKFEELLGGENK